MSDCDEVDMPLKASKAAGSSGLDQIRSIAKLCKTAGIRMVQAKWSRDMFVHFDDFALRC